MNHCFKEAQLDKARSWIQHDSGASVGLLQEAPLLDPAEGLWEVSDPGPVRCGTAVWAPSFERVAVSHRTSVPAGAVVAEIEGEDGPITFVSVYGKAETFLGTQWSIPNLHRIVSDLTPILADRRRRGRIIMGGDFNASVTWDEDPLSGPGSHSRFFDRLEAFGLTSVLDYRDPAEQTVTWSGTARKQIDYVFVSNELHAELLDVHWDEALSDHAALLVEVDL